MRKVLIALLLVISITSCNKAQEVEDTSSPQQEQIAWDHNTTIYDDVQSEEVEDSGVSNGPTEWIWDGSQYDTLYTGATLRISNIDGDKVYLVMSK
jgi:hypothetical protein